jgi:hypothetical protein
MKGQRKQYEEVKKLPATAVRVRNYADSKGITVAGVYKQYSKGLVRIVEFEGINFVIPERVSNAS